MTNIHSQRGGARLTNAATSTRGVASSLQGLLEVTHTVRSGADVGSVLEAMYAAKPSGTGIEVAA